MVQPPHFLAEVAAVLAREKPEEDLLDLQRVEWQLVGAESIYAEVGRVSLSGNYQEA